MKSSLKAIIAGVVCWACSIGSIWAATPAQDWMLVWSDEFDGPNIDTSKWSHEVNGWGGGNNELQYYTARTNNSFIENGNLVIQALKEIYTGPEGTRDYTSARMRTLNKGDWTYGRFEARIKLPYGQGLWPAFWMLPTDWVYGGWAASGEIDILELLGHQPNVLYGSINYGGQWPYNTWSQGRYTLPSGDFSDDFHVFAIEWEEGEIRWYVDDILYSIKNWWYTTSAPFPAPFDERFHILFNVAVGGIWPGSPDGSTVFPQRMTVDYVRVYTAIDTHYVDINNPSPSYPYTSWATAANDIQNAVNAASGGDTALIADGTYNISSQIDVRKKLTIRSVNGSDSVTIDAGGNSRVFYLRSNKGAITLDGLTITGGYANESARDGGGINAAGADAIVISDCIIEDNEAARNGGGLYCSNTNQVLDGCIIRNNVAGRNGGGMFRGTARNCVIIHNSANGGGGLANGTVHNCIIENNTAAGIGGGMKGGTAKNCVISHNSANFGGGIWNGIIYNCTVTLNRGRVGGGMQNGAAYNSIVWHNTGAMANQDMNAGVAATNCCSPDVDHGISGNITNMPLLVSASHITSNSPCLAAGSSLFASGTDVDGQAWSNPPSIGCDEFHGAGNITGPLSVSIEGAERVVEDFPSDLFADISGRVSFHVWDFGDGTVETNRLIPRHIWQAPGAYDVKMTAYSDSYPEGISTIRTIHVAALNEATLYVDVHTGNDSNSGLDWANAKRSINSAIESHQYFGGRVLVASGVYGLNEGIVVDKSLLVESVNGAAETIIDGNGAHLCVYLGPGCTLRGLSVRNGIGGIQGFFSSIVDSCWIYDNTGTGIWGGSAYDSVIRNNINTGGIGGGLDDANAYNCLVVSNLARIGGGIDMSGGNDGSIIGDYEIYNSVVAGNIAEEYGGGIFGGEAHNCLVSGNYATYNGGGIHKTTALSCTIVGNTSGGVGGANQSSVYNSIVCRNAGADSYPEISEDSLVVHSCSPELTAGVDGNINDDPQFMDPAAGDFRLSATSRCVDSGANGYVFSAWDIEGNERIMDGDFDGYPEVDMGAYELPVLPVEIDIKPGSDTNPINMNSKGRVPVALLGSDELNVVAINIDSIRFAGAAPAHHVFADVNGDRHPDLIVHFNTEELNLRNDSTFALLLGQTHEDMLLGGSDNIDIVSPKK